MRSVSDNKDIRETEDLDNTLMEVWGQRGRWGKGPRLSRTDRRRGWTASCNTGIRDMYAISVKCTYMEELLKVSLDGSVEPGLGLQIISHQRLRDALDYIVLTSNYKEDLDNGPTRGKEGGEEGKRGPGAYKADRCSAWAVSSNTSIRELYAMFVEYTYKERSLPRSL